MSKSKQLFEETRVLANVDDDVRNYFIRQWFEFCSKDQTPKELAESVQDNFAIKCTENQVINCFAVEIEELDAKYTMKNLNGY